jgi:fluoroquinolone transport system ATP-binding protein
VGDREERAVLDVDNLSFKYSGAEAPAVHDVCFRVESGEVFGFLGPSGAGKSTVQKILIRLLPLQRGEVRYDGRSLRELGRDFFADVGVSFEHPNLYPRLTGLENLRAFMGLYPGPHEDPRALLERVGLGEAAERRAEDYSKGMKQRLVFARSLLHRPKYLFLDEPTSGLDPRTARVIMAIIREHKQRGATILLTTHDMLVADGLADRIAFLHDGTIAACDTPRALKLMHGERSVKVEHRQNGVLSAETLFLDDPDDRSYLASLTREGDIETLHSQEATLDAIFVKLTGKELAP